MHSWLHQGAQSAFLFILRSVLAEQLIELVRLGVAHVLAFDVIDYVLADVLAAIADPLYGPRRPQHVQHLGYGARIFHHVGHQLANDGLVLPVHLVIFLVDGDGRLQIHAGKGVEHIVQHLDGAPAHVLERYQRRLRLVGVVGQHAGNLVRHVADALQVRDGLDDGHHQPQVGRGGLTLGDDAGALLIDRHFHGVDLVIVRHYLARRIQILIVDGRDGVGQLLLHQAAHHQHLIAHALKFGIELTGDVFIEVHIVHTNNPYAPSMP